MVEYKRNSRCINGYLKAKALRDLFLKRTMLLVDRSIFCFLHTEMRGLVCCKQDSPGVR